MPETIVEHAKAKVNLALHVLGRRADGYHDIDSIVAFADIVDVLSFEESAEMSLDIEGPFAAGLPVDDSNLVVRAHILLSAHTALPKFRIRLQKNLPVAAGIGGGSADAAAALRVFAKFAPKPLSNQLIKEIALQLGADVPVCLKQKACRMRGIGEQLADIKALPAPAILLVNPAVACETAAVFRALGLSHGQTHLTGLHPDNPESWRNDLTNAACKVHPLIAEVLATLQSIPNLLFVRMSGSGATCFALAPDVTTANAAAKMLRARQPEWWSVATALG